MGRETWSIYLRGKYNPEEKVGTDGYRILGDGRQFHGVEFRNVYSQLTL
jgi:hypothetical protein